MFFMVSEDSPRQGWGGGAGRPEGQAALNLLKEGAAALLLDRTMHPGRLDQGSGLSGWIWDPEGQLGDRLEGRGPWP